ncbi:hypothetical protein LCGC14_1939380 [marine sediment metagenome]|uniref:Uncharacterized protein n=1 Tax=marine sediment metagenome TaxID=412755 RepID=A0A0F9FL15_9ZZZZ
MEDAFPVPHNVSHQNGGADEVDVDGLSGELADVQPPKTHAAAHKSGGSDAFGSGDLLEAVVKRLQESAGPTGLTLGAIVDGEFLKRVGATIVSAVAGGGGVEAWIHVYRVVPYVIVSSNTWYDLPWNVTSPTKTGITHNSGVNPEQITIDTVGTYRITWELHTQLALQVVYASRLLDDGAEIPGSYRSIGSHSVVPNAISGSIIVAIAAASVIELQVGADTPNSQINYRDDASLPDPTTFVGASLTVERIGD